jgi:hypothetical protein
MKEVAAQLGTSRKTVEQYWSRIYLKAGARSQLDVRLVVDGPRVPVDQAIFGLPVGPGPPLPAWGPPPQGTANGGGGGW